MEVRVDNQAQLDEIGKYIVPGEELLDVYDLDGSHLDFVGITDKRLIHHSGGMSRYRVINSVLWRHIISVRCSYDSKLHTLTRTVYYDDASAAGKALIFSSNEQAQGAYVAIVTQLLQNEIAG